MGKQGVNVLIVDDDKSILRILTRILQKHGYNVDTAETGREAEEKRGNELYDLAIIDVKLPDTDGIDLLSEFQKTKPNMVKIILTGFPSIDNGVKAMNAGADAYLIKPVKPEELLKIINEKLKERRQTRPA